MKERALTIILLIVAFVPAWAQGTHRLSDEPYRGLNKLPNGDPAVSRTISGTVLTIEGRAIRDAYIAVRNLNGTLQASGYSLPNGTFAFDLPPGHYDVIATVGVQEARQQVRVELGPTEVELRMASLTATRGSGSSHSISVTEMKVPDRARQGMDKAERAFRKNKLDEARKETDKALQIAPGYARALTLRAVLDLNDNKVDQAQRELETAIESDSRYGMAYVVLGSVYNMKSRFDDALRTLRQAISLVPNSWQVYFESAQALLGQGQYSDSLREVDRAAQFVPEKYLAIHLVRAHALLGLKDYRAAATELEQYLGGDPNGLDSTQARQTLDQLRAFMTSNQK